ncbi:MAG: Na(+)/H(+) antiporter subunit D [Xanthomonadales bacterium PRO6]|nr:NAD(P)H-quinone oxidoreductase subunit 2, chloroplastic [Xanthomonadales bacterium]MCE7931218.1 Na(+)/H(+) antiporter subunit D [Xanthomonadales bacterium PRO6]
MLELAFPPAFVLILGALLVAVVRPGLRPLVLLGAPLLTLWAIWRLPDGVLLTAPFLGYDIELVEADALRRLFATVFALMAFAGGLFGLLQARTRELAAAYAYAAGAIGVCFAGDLITLFLFWEFMALFSTVVIWCGEGENARRAGLRYALMHLVGGVLLKIGIEGVMVHTGSVDVRALALDSFDAWVLLAGVLVNAAAPPVSAWIADAYPEGSPFGAVFLSAFTTKTAVLALILLFPGAQILVWIGLWMIFYGILYALLENDMRRILAYSIVNQVGFMVCGVGIGTGMALNGAAAHAFAHILYKALLLMSAGAVLHQTGKRKCSDLGGLWHSMPVTTACGIVGALAISAFPFTSGFISKSMIGQAAADQHLMLVWFLLTAASAGVFLHAGIKFPWFVFFQKDSGLRPPDPPWNMRAAMILLAAACIALGCFPWMLYELLPYPVDYLPYTGAHVVTQFQLLLFAGLAFFALLPLMQRTLTISLDFDWLWRVAMVELAAGIARAWRALGDASRALWQRRAGLWLRRGLALVAPDGILARTQPVASMALWVLLVLALLIGLARV